MTVRHINYVAIIADKSKNYKINMKLSENDQSNML